MCLIQPDVRAEPTISPAEILARNFAGLGAEGHITRMTCQVSIQENIVSVHQLPMLSS